MTPGQKDEIPKWLRIYFRLPQEMDEKILSKVGLDRYNLKELNSYNAMYDRLFLEETEQIVMAYETYRYKIFVRALSGRPLPDLPDRLTLCDCLTHGMLVLLTACQSDSWHVSLFLLPRL